MQLAVPSPGFNWQLIIDNCQLSMTSPKEVVIGQLSLSRPHRLWYNPHICAYVPFPSERLESLMNRAFRLTALAVLLLGNSLLAQNVPMPLPKAETFWNVDDVHQGMKGQGKSVIKGTKIESFDAEVIGVLKNTSPGRDLILCKLSGMNLDKTGVIAGMSGSPIYIEGKLLGAVAYAWAFGKEPIAGVTPFSQMQSFAAAYEPRGRRHAEEQAGARRPGEADPAGWPRIPGRDDRGRLPRAAAGVGRRHVDDPAEDAGDDDRHVGTQPGGDARTLQRLRPGADARRRGGCQHPRRRARRPHRTRQRPVSRADHGRL